MKFFIFKSHINCSLVNGKLDVDKFNRFAEGIILKIKETISCENVLCYICEQKSSHSYTYNSYQIYPLLERSYQKSDIDDYFIEKSKEYKNWIFWKKRHIFENDNAWMHAIEKIAYVKPSVMIIEASDESICWSNTSTRWPHKTRNICCKLSIKPNVIWDVYFDAVFEIVCKYRSIPKNVIFVYHGKNKFCILKEDTKANEIKIVFNDIKIDIKMVYLERSIVHDLQAFNFSEKNNIRFHLHMDTHRFINNVLRTF